MYKLKEFCNEKYTRIALDKDENPVFLAESSWTLQMAQEKNPDIVFHFTSEMK